MTPAHEWRRRGALLLFWLVPALMGTLGFVLVPSRLNPGLSVAGILGSQLLMWSGWAAWTALTWWVGDQVRFRSGAWLRAALVHLVLGAVVVVGQILVQAEVGVAFGIAEPRHLDSTIVIGIRSYGDVFTVIYCAIVVAQQALRWYADWQQEKVRAARLGADLVQAQLRTLQAQLNPHFLFNALNSVVTLIGRDPALAQRTVVQLADLLRATLRASDAQEVPLAQELEFTRRYLALEQVRFADRLTVHGPDGPVPATLVPAFALQPLVENAIQHGIARQAGPGAITLAVSRDGDTVLLRVSDTGPGLAAPGTSRGAGTGLANLRSRLERLHGPAASLTLRDFPGRGVEAELRLPVRAVPD